MNTSSGVIHESFGAPSDASAVIPSTRLFYWSVRRELWEYRSIYLAPLSVAGVFLVGFLMSFPNRARHEFGLHTGQTVTLLSPYEIAGGIMMFTAILLSTFYCLDALYSERRDRSIVFWKSLPVSDLTTVLAKVSIPLVVVPVICSVVGAILQLIMLLLSSTMLAASGMSVVSLWNQVPWLRMSLLMLYHILTAHALWPAPVFAWMLFVSGWARRAPFLWATLPVLAIAGVEKIAFRTAHFVNLVGERLIGYAPVNTSAPLPAPNSVGLDLFPTDPMTHVHPGVFLSDPGLWGGLAIAALFVAAAVMLRRRQGPI